MAFDFNIMETDRTIVFKGTEYRVIQESESGLLIVAREEDVKNKNYPLQLVAIPEYGNTQ